MAGEPSRPAGPSVPPQGAAHPTALLLHPVTLLALLVLVLNDGWLRGASPGWVTGKLSDVAALVLFPAVLATGGALLAAALRRLAGRAPRGVAPPGPAVLALACLLPAAILAVINLSAAGRDLYLGLLGALDPGGRIGPFHYTMDASDLVTLPFAAVPWLLGRRLWPPGAHR